MVLIRIYLFALQISIIANYDYVIIERAGSAENIGIITIDRPEALNALDNAVMAQLADALEKFDADKTIDVIIITGSEGIFSSGADVKEMAKYSYSEVVAEDIRGNWIKILKVAKPVIAAVNGYCMSAGLELALMCDIIYAGSEAIFGLPEILYGAIPGTGGTQRLTKTVGKSMAMEIILSGKSVYALEAERIGLVNKVVPAEDLLREAISLAVNIAKNSQTILAISKDAVNTALETHLQQGLIHERHSFQFTFTTKDHFEGLLAFIENRPAEFIDE